jgi:hypothetical protein
MLQSYEILYTRSYFQAGGGQKGRLTCLFRTLVPMIVELGFVVSQAEPGSAMWVECRNSDREKEILSRGSKHVILRRRQQCQSTRC